MGDAAILRTDRSRRGPASPDIPLVVDLDGTLLRTDMLHEASVRLLRDRPWDVARIPYWLSQGKAVLKQRVAERTEFDPALLPYRDELLDWLRGQRDAGRRLVLATASDDSVAESIARHLDLFDEVIASDGTTNLTGRRKAEALEQRFGRGGFDYAGNSAVDLPVWARARRSVVVDAPPGVARRARDHGTVEREFARVDLGYGDWRRILRVHQWMKNLLLFVPLFASHQVTDGAAWTALAFAFWAFSLCASAVYIGNDLFDLESDRQHPRKRDRPFASGTAPIWLGVAVAPLLLAASLLLALQVGGTFPLWLAAYFALTCCYSWFLKRIVLIDCLTLAMLYTVRIVAGAAAAGLEPSFWLLAFSLSLFLSLAFVKRYAELVVQAGNGTRKMHGRGYYTGDASLIQTFGVTSGYAAVLVLALYLNSEAVIRLYRNPEMVGAAVPVLLFWISWVWLQTYRGNMHDDPVVFAMKDRTSLAAGAAFGGVLLAASTGLPW